MAQFESTAPFGCLKQRFAVANEERMKGESQRIEQPGIEQASNDRRAARRSPSETGTEAHSAACSRNISDVNK